MSMAFYDISELEAGMDSPAAPDRRYRIEVVLDASGRLVSAQTDPATPRVIEHLTRAIAAGGVTR